MVEDRDEVTARSREIEALCALLEYSKVRAEDLGLDALSISLESALKIARMDLAATGVDVTDFWGPRM